MSLILFDFDGVLADTLDDLLRFGQEACDELGIAHIATREDLDVLEVMSFATYGKQLGVPDALVDEFVQKCLQKVAQKETPPALFDGLGSVIERLAAEHVLAIVTSNNVENVSAFLAHHGLTDFFRVIYGVDTPGSKTEKIQRAKREFARNGESVFMVGDSVSDVRAAREAGVASVAVSWGHQSAERLSALKPDRLVNTPAELAEILPLILHQGNMSMVPDRIVTPLELRRNNGDRGSRKFVAYKGVVYDVSDCPKWRGDLHEQLHFPGQDLTSEFPDAPHKEEVFLHECVKIVGRLAEETVER